MLKCVVFDMDGTLLDTERLAVQFWIDLGKAHGVDLPLDFVVSNCGRPRDSTLKRYQEHYPTLPVEEAIAHRDEWWEEQAAKGRIHTMPGAMEILRHLKEKGVTAVLATSTSYPRAIREVEETGLTPYLSGITSGDMLPPERGKPLPDIFLRAMENAGFLPEECLVIEDSVSGSLGGIASGAKTIMIPDQRQPDEELRSKLYRCLNSLHDLVSVVDELLEEK